ncbi:MAG: hypothetical protein NTX25_20945, partial [Proteobacteria bacterium]|nr:hypothetical protein [Pseudomonadota bacterium]
MRDIMSPSASPDGIFIEHGKLGITRINKRIVGIAIIVFGGAAIILLATISSHGKSSERNSDSSQPLGQQKSAPASPPAIKEAALSNGPLPQNTIKAQQGVFASDPKAQSDELEFQKEIRRYEHQQHMTRLQRRDTGYTAPMEIKGGLTEASAQIANTYQDAQAEGQRMQRFPEGAREARSEATLALNDPSKDPNLQTRKESFFNQQIASNYLPHQKVAPLSPYEVKQGTVIPGVMVTGINSDLPGQIIGQVSQNVFDSVSGKNLLIPQGTKIIGSYDSFVAVGQERALVAWRRLVFPDGMAIDLLGMSGADQGGYAGLSDQVNNHYFKIFGSALMLSLVGAGYQISQPQHDGRQFPSNQDLLASEVG